MMLALAPQVVERLAIIEAEEGIPPAELAHQAIEIWSQLDRSERVALGFTALQIVAQRMKGDAR